MEENTALASSGFLWHKAGMTDGPKDAHKRLQSLLREALKVTRSLPPKPETVEEMAASYDGHVPDPSQYQVGLYGGTRY